MSSLNDGDVFLLDMGNVVYRWIGRQAGMYVHNEAVVDSALINYRFMAINISCSWN